MKLPTESSLLWAQVYNQFDYFLTDANLLSEAEHNAITLKCEEKTPYFSKVLLQS